MTYIAYICDQLRFRKFAGLGCLSLFDNSGAPSHKYPEISGMSYSLIPAAYKTPCPKPTAFNDMRSGLGLGWHC